MKSKGQLLSPKRRMFIGAIAVGSGLSTTGYWFTKSSKRSSTDDDTTLHSIIDTLVPTDISAGAIDAKLDVILSEKLRFQRGLAQKVNSLIKVVNKTALAKFRSRFYELDIDRREALLGGLLKSDAPLVARNNLRQIRQLVLIDFYSSKIGQESIDYLLPAYYQAY